LTEVDPVDMFYHVLMVSKGVSFPSDVFPSFNMAWPGFPTRKWKHNSERKIGDIKEAAWWILESVTKKTRRTQKKKVLKLVELPDFDVSLKQS
jgi:hypothetical protein